ncbi:MAG: septum site-determining protein MinD [Oscillospiraceae bacterium]
MGAVVAVVSGKGGTGKTSLTGGVAACLAAMGRRVLCVDADVGLRNLDIALGLSDRVGMDCSDVLQGRCALSDALVAHPKIEGLFLLAAPQTRNPKQEILRGLDALVLEAKEQFDDVLIDCPAGLGPGFRAAAGCADRAVVVTTIDPASLRDAQQAISVLGEMGVSLRHLVVNRVQPRVLRRMKTNLDDIMDAVSLPLLGVVPEDERVVLAAGGGVPLVLFGKSKAAVAFLHIAQRLTGARVPLMRIR